MLKKLLNPLFEPIDIAPLVFFRVAFGSLMLWEVWRYFYYDRIARYYVEPTFFFHYLGFDWLQPLPGEGMFVLFYGLGLLAIAITLGFCYRVSMILFWLAFTYVFLLDQAQYLNHFYLVCLISFLLIFVPAHRALSVDAWLRPSIRSQTAPAWALWILRSQMAIVYFFGGIAKLNVDWMGGEPLRTWLAARTDFPLIGGLFTEEWMVYLFSYGGLLLDLCIVPLLLWRRTRIPALLLASAFHVTNSQLFNIGIFPWMAISATLIFMPPAWFRLRGLFRASPDIPDSTLPSGVSHRNMILAGIMVYFAVQTLMPLRHLLYPGDPSWTEEGHTLAWHMRLRDKQGAITLFASDPGTGTTWPLDSARYLSSRQFDQMKDNPHMILRFAHGLAKTLEAEGINGVQIRAWAMISLNSRTSQLLLDPTADLVQEPDHLLAADWILPLTQQPVPHEPVPTLLLSRRFEDVLLLINITETAYPLDRLQMRADDHHLSAADFGVQALQPGECVLAHTEGADLSAVFVPCNETGSRPVISTQLLDSACASINCMVVDKDAL